MNKNWAFLVGVNFYEHSNESEHLKYAIFDAKCMKEFLCKQVGFDEDKVLLYSDNSEPIGSSKQIQTRPTRSNLRRLLLDKTKDAIGADNLWFFFSGHGVAKNNQDYLLPCDAYFRDVEGTAIDVNFVIGRLKESKAQNLVMVLDMCRNSLQGSKGYGSELGSNTRKIAQTQGIITIFSCSQGEKSYEIPELNQGVFTYALLEGLKTHQTPQSLNQYLQHRVPQLNREYGKPDQLPEISLNSISNCDLPLLPNLKGQLFYSKGMFQKQSLNIPSTSLDTTDKLVRSEEQKSLTLQVPNTSIIDFEFVKINETGKERTRYISQTSCFTEDLGNGVTLEMIVIPAGTFLMGSPEFEVKRDRYDEPQHSVTVQQCFMSKYPITKAQWKVVASLPMIQRKLKPLPSRRGGKNHPITNISWDEAIEFCDRLSQKTGNEYRLPTEAEWEYACRAGSTTPFHFGETITADLANYDGTYPYGLGPTGINRKETTPVGSLQVANAFGLFDMHGNVWEWCLDDWDENYNELSTNQQPCANKRDNLYRVLRGGSWRNEALKCRCACRFFDTFDKKAPHIGFRIVKSF